MSYKFEKLEVWQLALEYSDLIYDIVERLPLSEAYNLKSQVTRAATSIALNIAEGSTGQSDAEQARFINYAVRSLVEKVACIHLINRRGWLDKTDPLRDAYKASEKLFAKLQAFRRSLLSNRLGEGSETFEADSDIPR